ncbi:acetate/propionate family kinase [Roseococcus sp. YIM B11640]|uniref:acetate/propionate family kinase n=1 Tax=Roseococcus sp. YIM B11640 TaxID=3133973 RepID=UPI003C7EC4EF
MNPVIGVVNAGSSSLKFSFYEGERSLLSGQIDGIGVRVGSRAKNAAGQSIPGPDVLTKPPSSPAEAVALLPPWLRGVLDGHDLVALGHRVVHGGPRHSKPERVTPGLLDELAALSQLAPLHQPHNLAPIRAILDLAPDIPQVACFDTAFHHTIADVERNFAIPRELTARGIRRYGFHGLSYEYIASCLPRLTPAIAQGRVIAAHLGNGASLCALHAGRSVATTMGFSALDGLPMGTRSGEMDPGLVLYLMQNEGMSAKEIEDFLYRRCGMLGVSGISSDFRDLLESDAPEAREAIALFVHRVARNIGALAAALGGLDGIVFTAGVGENAAAIRAAVLERCAWLGVGLDAAANAANGPCLTTPGSRVAAHVIPTDENLMILRHTRAVLET